MSRIRAVLEPGKDTAPELHRISGTLRLVPKGRSVLDNEAGVFSQSDGTNTRVCAPLSDVLKAHGRRRLNEARSPAGKERHGVRGQANPGTDLRSLQEAEAIAVASQLRARLGYLTLLL